MSKPPKYPLSADQRKKKNNKDLKKRLRDSEKQLSKMTNYEPDITPTWMVAIHNVLQNQIVIMAALLDE